MIGAVFSGAESGIDDVGIDSCVAASAMLERGPSSFPGISKRIDGRRNTFNTTSNQRNQDSGFDVILGKASG